MSKIKEASQFTNGAWSTPTPIGADDANIDITSATTNPTDTTATADGLVAADVTASSGDTDASAWTKFNRFRKRVYNSFSTLAGKTLATAYTTSSPANKVYSASVLNDYMSNVVGYTGTTAPSAGSVASQLSSLNDNIDSLFSRTFYNREGYWGIEKNNGIAIDSDFNNIVTNGIANTIQGWTNRPSGEDGWGTLAVFSNGSAHVMQLFNCWNTQHMYIRYKYNSSWKGWKRISDTVIKTSITASFSDYAAFISSSTLGVTPSDYCWVILPTSNAWEYFPFVSGVNSTQITIRCWTISTTSSATVALKNSGSLIFDIIGISLN